MDEEDGKTTGTESVPPPVRASLGLGEMLVMALVTGGQSTVLSMIVDPTIQAEIAIIALTVGVAAGLFSSREDRPGDVLDVRVRVLRFLLIDFAFLICALLVFSSTRGE